MIVTISREFGAGAVAIAKIVAERCGLRLIVDDLPQIVSDRLGLLREEALNDEDSVPSVFERLVAQLPGATLDIAATPGFEEIDAYDTLRRKIEHNLQDAAGSIEAVILGWAASQVLGVRWDVVRVFLHAPRNWRIERLVQVFDYTPGQARAAIERVDGARERYLSEYYGLFWGNAHNYDLTMDTSRMSVNDIAETIISVVVARYQQV